MKGDAGPAPQTAQFGIALLRDPDPVEVTDEADSVSSTALRAQLAAREAEIESLIAAKRESDREAIEVRLLLREAEDRVNRLTQGLPYRVGRAVADARRSPRDALRLPLRLYRLLREDRRTKAPELTDLAAAKTESLPVSHQTRLVEDGLGQLSRSGLEIALNWARRCSADRAVVGHVLGAMAQRVVAVDGRAAAALAREAMLMHPGQSRTVRVALALADMGAIEEPAALLRLYRKLGGPLQPAEQRRVDIVMAHDRLRTTPPSFLPARAPEPARDLRIAVLHPGAVLPDRLASACASLAGQGWSVHPLAAPERATSGEAEPGEPAGTRRCRPVEPAMEAIDSYAGEASGALREALESIGATLLHCEWKAGPALAAAHAAAAMGLPLILSISDTGGAGLLAEPADEVAALHLALLGAVAARARLVLVPGRMLAERLREKGVPSQAIWVVEDKDALAETLQRAYRVACG
jgi:hypothetical protein